MNNDQFRRLVASSPKEQQNTSATPRPGATPSALGTKKSSFVPMTPRAVKGGIGVDFARQVRERNASQQPAKKFKTSAPKGTKFGEGYTDRAKARAEAEENGDGDDKAERVKALEEQMKLGQISQETFEALRDKITGGDLSSTHLVKGLDRQLLERVRRGEDVYGTGSSTNAAQESSPDVDDELDKLGDKDVEAVKKETVKKQGVMAPPPVAGKKRSRDEIMAELKAQRKAAKEAREAAEPQLGERWGKVGEKKKPRFEIDEKGREVMITVDEKGNVKKRVRKVQPPTEQVQETMRAPDASKAVLGADVSIPEPAKVAQTPAEAEDEDEDIFEGMGTDYNPLGNMDDEDSDEDSNAEERPPAKKASKEASAEPGPGDSDGEEAPTPPSKPAAAAPKPTAPRNYFGERASEDTDTSHDHLAGIQEVLKKAAKMDPLRSGEGDSRDPEAEARRKRHAQMLANQDRDAEDMDMGFGGSRLDDEGDGGEDGSKIKLSEWKGGADDGWEDDDGKAGGKGKKRKPKKRKGDASNMGDIMRVIEGRKGGAAKG